MVCRHFEKDPFAEQSTGTKLEVEQNELRESDIFSLRNLHAIEQAAVYMSFPTLRVLR